MTLGPADPDLSQGAEAAGLCTQCGYSLVGLKVGGRCPECSREIPPAGITPLLRIEQPWRVQMLVSGVRFVRISIGLAGLACMVGLVQTWLGRSLLHGMSAIGLVFESAWFIWIAGWAMLSVDDAETSPKRLRSNLIIMRVMLVAQLISWFAAISMVLEVESPLEPVVCLSGPSLIVLLVVAFGRLMRLSDRCEAMGFWGGMGKAIRVVGLAIGLAVVGVIVGILVSMPIGNVLAGAGMLAAVFGYLGAIFLWLMALERGLLVEHRASVARSESAGRASEGDGSSRVARPPQE